MKLYPLAAAAMLFAGGSAFAYAPTSDMTKSDLLTVAGKGAKATPFKLYADKPAKAAPVARFADGKPLLVPAATVTWEKAEPVAGNPDLDLAETSIDDSVPAEPAVSDPADTVPAVGGPFEEVASADLNTRPASQNYPACRPGPGDDNCIQLYEPGVRTALAAWNAPTGGLANGTEVAMGGPDEPISDDSAQGIAMNGDGVIAEESGETQDMAEI